MGDAVYQRACDDMDRNKVGEGIMDWSQKEKVLAKLGHRNFESEDHFDEWFAEQEDCVQKRIRQAFCRADHEHSFNWGRRYFKVKIYN